LFQRSYGNPHPDPRNYKKGTKCEKYLSSICIYKNVSSSFLELMVLSEKRKEILLFLKESPKTILEIKEFLNLSSVAVLPQLKKLRENSLVIKKGEVYSLSPLGIAIVGRLQPMVDLLKVFGSEYSYWENHAIDCIPAPFMGRIGELSNCTLSQPPDKTRLFDLHIECVENVEKSNKISCIFSFFHPSYLSFYTDFIKMEKEVSIIVTSHVYERIKREFEDILRKSFKFGNASFYVCSREIELSYLVTDTFLSLTLPFSDGSFDYQRDVLCFDPAALKWGEDLFAYYRDISNKITDV